MDVRYQLMVLISLGFFFSAMALEKEETFANLEDEKVHRRRIDEVVGKKPLRSVD